MSRVRTEHHSVRGLVVNDLAHSYRGSVEEVTTQPRRISIHQDPFDVSVDKCLYYLLDAVIFLVLKLETNIVVNTVRNIFQRELAEIYRSCWREYFPRLGVVS